MIEKNKILNNIWTIPNIMSLIRLALAPIIAHCIYYNYNGLTITLALIAGLLDIFDGYIARKYNLTSEFGKIIDPFADKVTYAFVVVSMLIKGLLPLWYVLLFVGRDILILLGGVIFAKKVQEVPQSDTLGKVSIFINAIAIFLILCGVKFLNGPILWIFIIILYSSTFNYLMKGLRKIKKTN